jgi:hypothetical protein
VTAMQWKPIETFPPDLELEDAIVWNGHVVGIGYRNDGYWFDPRIADHQDDRIVPQPTHFMLFPPPPSSED